MKQLEDERDKLKRKLETTIKDNWQKQEED